MVTKAAIEAKIRELATRKRLPVRSPRTLSGALARARLLRSGASLRHLYGLPHCVTSLKRICATGRVVRSPRAPP